MFLVAPRGEDGVAVVDITSKRRTCEQGSSALANLERVATSARPGRPLLATALAELLNFSSMEFFYGLLFEALPPWLWYWL